MKTELTWRSLVKMEQDIVRELAKANHAMNPYEVYFKIITNASVDALIKFQKEPETYGDAAYDSLTYFIIDKNNDFNIPKNKTTLKKLVNLLRKTGRYEIPDYAKVVRILENATELKLLEKRIDAGGRSTAVYYLANGVHRLLLDSKKAKLLY